jgi:ketosteroid isomerase-like protein
VCPHEHPDADRARSLAVAERVGFWGGFHGGSERLERCQRLAGSVTCPRALTESAVHLALAPHDPATWVMGMGRYDRQRWAQSWQELFRTHRLVHNRRNIVKISITKEGDGALAVVDIDTLWRDAQGNPNQWLGRVGKVYTRLANGEYKLIMRTGALDYSRTGSF